MQLSPIRTGSTLVYNLMRGALDDKKVVKQHTYSPWFGHLPIVATVRHPYDAVASGCWANKFALSDKGVCEAAEAFLKQGAQDLIRIKDFPNVLVLRYEDFIADYIVIYREMERFFARPIPDALRAQLSDQHGLEKARAMADSEKDFESWDAETMIHGGHVSANATRLGYGRELFTAGQLRHLSDVFRPFMQAFDYEAKGGSS